MSGRTKEFFEYVIPSVLAFALSGVYTIVDGFFVGQSLGDIGLAAITLGYPVTALIVAVGTGLGLAAAIRFTILNAQSETQKAQECFSAASLLMLLTAAVLTALLFFFADPILGFLGARNEALRLAAEYARIIALGAVFQLLATGFVPFIRNMGGASFAMVAMILGFVTNIVLDYALVWVANWGMTGAALATIIGQAVTMLAAIVFFVRKKCRLRLPEAKRLRSFWGETLKVSLSPFGLTFSPTVTMMLMNRFLLLYGDEQAVTIYGCIGYIISIIYLLLQGVGDGSQPHISEQYGRGDRAAVRHSLSMAYMAAAVVTVACMLGVFLARDKVGVLFGASAQSNVGVAQMLPYYLAPLLFLAYVRITTSYFYATEETILSYIIVYAEPVFTLLLLLILPQFLKLTGVWLAVPLAQTATFAVGLVESRVAKQKAV